MDLPVTLTYTPTSTVTVDYAVTGGTATSADYSLSGTQLTFGVGVTTQTIPLTIINDSLNENDETIVVTLSNPSGAILGTNVSYTYTITNDDPAPTVAFAATSSSGDESAGTVNLAVTLSVASGKTVTVDYAVTGGTATSPADFTVAGTQLTFNPGDTTQNVAVTIVDDSVAEAAETIEITLSNPTNASLGTNTVYTYTITANDNQAPTVDAGADQTITLPTDTVNLDGTVSDDGYPAALTVTWSKVSGPGTVTFGNANTVDTTATFSEAGTYVLQLLADDSALTASDTCTITVNAVNNQAPTVDAGVDQTITLPTDTVNLDGTVSDDGYPNPPAQVTVTWSKVSGPGTVTFGNANAVDTTDYL